MQKQKSTVSTINDVYDTVWQARCAVSGIKDMAGMTNQPLSITGDELACLLAPVEDQLVSALNGLTQPLPH